MNFFNQLHRIFKVSKMVEVLKEKVLKTEDKAVIVSQWTSFLNLIALQLKLDGVKYDQLDGTVAVSKRMSIVDNFNDPKSKLKVSINLSYCGSIYLKILWS